MMRRRAGRGVVPWCVQPPARSRDRLARGGVSGSRSSSRRAPAHDPASSQRRDFVRKMLRSHALFSGRRAPVALAGLASLVVVGVAIGATSHGAVAPTNETAPTITGNPVVGSKLTAKPGTWNGSSPFSFQYQWLICGAKGEACSNIGGETDNTYTVRSGDE